MSKIVTDPTECPSAFETALNKGDLEGIVDLYEESAVIRVQSNEVHSGSNAVRSEMQQLIMGKAQISNTLRHMLRCGDTALIIVDYVLRLSVPDGSPAPLTGTATNVIREHPQLGWRMLVANPQGVA